MNIQEALIFTLDRGASDLFITGGKRPYVRQFGTLRPIADHPVAPAELDAFRRQVLSREAEAEFQRTGGADAACEIDEQHRYRLNFLTAQGQPGLVARPLRSGDGLYFDQLHLPAAVLEKLAAAPRGLILVCGSAGSGKSTTLSALVNYINDHFERHIVMIEDPIEYLHHDKTSLITQREVNTDTSSFSEALKHVVRESPDVIVIGEMRDMATMQTAISAALTGHLVISTIHTADTSLAIERIINYFPEQLRQMVAEDIALALQGVLAQRLIPCADGSGMIPAVEILLGTPLVRHLIARREFNDLDEALKRGKESGMITFNRAIFELVRGRQIALNEALRFVTNREEFELLQRGMESGNDSFRHNFEATEFETAELDMKQLLKAAVGNGASDLLLTVGSQPMLRVNSFLLPLDTNVLRPYETQQLLYSILSPRQRAEFEERREIDFALTIKLKSSRAPADAPAEAYRFRINGFFQRGHVGAALRVIPRRIPTPEDLLIPASVVRFCDKKSGLVLVTGPTGHGKTTTLASLVDCINHKYSYHIVTVEDPIEYVHTHDKSIIEQRELHADTLSFANALKYVLRQDPDVIMVGEMRDAETMAAAITAAETGHLVFATLHTSNAPQSIDRIVDSFPPHQQPQIRIQLAGTLLGVIAQRLIPRQDGNGRVAAFEVMVGTPPIAALIRDGKTSQLASILETSFKDGMITMDKALDELYGKALISRADYDSLRQIYRTVKEY